MRKEVALRVLLSFVLVVAGLPGFASACRMMSRTAAPVAKCGPKCCDARNGGECEKAAAHHAGCPAYGAGSAGVSARSNRVSGSCALPSGAAPIAATLAAPHEEVSVHVALELPPVAAPVRNLVVAAPSRLRVGIVGLDAGPPPHSAHRSDVGRSPPAAV